MRETTGLSKKALATAISKRLESIVRGGSKYYNAQEKFRNYRRATEFEPVVSYDYNLCPIIPNKLNFFSKKALISVVETLQQETLSAKHINQYDGYIADMQMVLEEA